MLNFLAPFKSYLYAAAGVSLAAVLVLLSHYYHKSQTEHDAAVRAEMGRDSAIASYDAAIGLIKQRNARIEELGISYAQATNRNKALLDKFSRHNIDEDLKAKPDATARAINNMVNGMYGQIQCASGADCADGPTHNSPP